MSHRRKMSRTGKGSRGCDLGCANLHLAALGLINEPSDGVMAVTFEDGRNILLVDADRAAAVSATAEGKAGLHDLLDDYIATYGDPMNVDLED